MTARYGPGIALLVVDVQNDFADPAGSLYVAGGEEIVEGVNAEVAAAVAAGSPVFYSQDWHPARTPHFVTDGGVWPPHCVAGTAGASFHPDLVVSGEVIRKGVDGADGYSAFSVRDPASGHRSATVLGERLARLGVSTLVVVGLAGDHCVRESALDARLLGLTVTLPLARTRFVNLHPGDEERAVEAMRDAGVLVG
ncbi:nicotinamidase-like amidase [Frankia torreyi]|uniref:nicotinamidase n=1 Tax=Frankia torreyi TaxID=1856 RepID=A0A0D8BKZ1_9ACTN|nr:MULTISPECIES: isochorismatase family protein [Frankia]KJE24755.1 nicotinamidase-like amidase [Frankia torreyi]KQC39160.1 isochorismatase [Frankia sp. ACN1ag]